MEFWGVEVPSGKPLTCKPGADSYVHVSQAALGDNKSGKGNDRVVLKVKVGSIEVVVGTLSQGKCDQTTLDLIFEKDFVLSHNSSGSVYFCGYKTDAVRDDVSGSSEEDEFDDDDSEEDTPELMQPAAKENGKFGLKAGKVEAVTNKPPVKSPASKVEMPSVEAKPKAKAAKVEELSKDATEKSDDDDEDDEEEDEDEDEDDDMLGSGSDDDDDVDSDEGDSDEEDESEEKEPKSAGKKRSLPSVKPGLPGKKSKIATPGKPDVKVPSVPASTPKQQQQSAKKEVLAKKTPGKENTTTPASGKKLGQHFCEPCKKNFNSESALNQHKLAKHK